MSQETGQWLNQNTLIGFTDKRGNAWHYRASDQGAEPNHYPGAIPIEDVRRRLFGWEFVEGDVKSTATILTPDGVETFTITDPDRKSILRPPRAFGADDPGAMLGLFKSGYKIHQFDQWLLENLKWILDSGLDIGSAGILKGGAVGWVSVEAPDTLVTPEGVEFRPHINAATSVDGSLSSTYNKSVTMPVCDNTLSVALADKLFRLKIKHSTNSLGKLSEVRDALGIVHEIAEDFEAKVAMLTNVTVSEGDWAKFLDEINPIPEDDGRGKTIATTKRESLTRLWNHDQRVSPWKNTAFGVLQAVNTYTHHEQNVRGESRADRNALRAVTGGVDKLDGETIATLDKVLVGA